MRTVFGPKSKKLLYLDRLKELESGDYFCEWRTNDEVVWRVNEGVPARWTQLHSCGLYKYMKRLESDMEDEYRTVMGKRVRFWRKKV